MARLAGKGRSAGCRWVCRHDSRLSREQRVEYAQHAGSTLQTAWITSSFRTVQWRSLRECARGGFPGRETRVGRMGRKLFILAALAVIGAAVAAAVASASSIISTDSSGVSVNLPGGTNLPPVGTLPQCSNLRDDDGDGLTDLADPDCSGPLDSSETGPPPPTSQPTGPTGPTGSPGSTGSSGSTGSTGSTGGSVGQTGGGGSTGGSVAGGGEGKGGAANTRHHPRGA